LILLAGGEAAIGQEPLDLRGTRRPADGAHIVDGRIRHTPSGTEDVPGHDTLQQHTSTFVFRFEGQDGRTFWGTVVGRGLEEADRPSVPARLAAVLR
jgi:hypothetical protein